MSVTPRATLMSGEQLSNPVRKTLPALAVSCRWPTPGPSADAAKCHTMQHEVEKKRPRVTAAACNRMQHEIRKTVPSSRRSRVVALESHFAGAPHHRFFAKRTQSPAGLRAEPLNDKRTFS